MAIQFNPNVNPGGYAAAGPAQIERFEPGGRQSFGKAIADSFKNVTPTAANRMLHRRSAQRKQQEFNSVVASVAKADMTSSCLVGCATSLVEAYKETHRMQV